MHVGMFEARAGSVKAWLAEWRREPAPARLDPFKAPRARGPVRVQDAFDGLQGGWLGEVKKPASRPLATSSGCA